MRRRRRFKQTISLKDRLASFAKEARDRALRLPPGSEREAMLKKVSQADIAAHLDEWANSPGLQPPK
jgi:leucyl aminopeptidase